MRPTARLTALTAAATLSLSGLAAVSGTAQADASYGRLFGPAGTPIAGAPFDLDGKLATKLKRTVKLQAKKGTKYVVVATTTSRKNGTFTFEGVELKKTTTLRAYAPSYKATPKATRKAPKVYTDPVSVEVEAQQAHVVALPPIAQQGAGTAAPSDDPVVSARFSPARPGRKVALQQKKGDDWVTVQTGTQDRSGHAVFSVPSHATFRAVATRTKEAPEIATGATTTRAWAADFEDTFEGNALDPAVWQTEVRQPTEGMRTCVRTDPSMATVSGGTLKLGVAYDPARAGETCTFTTRYGAGSSPYMLNSQVSTSEAYDFTHGVVAARMKLQAPQGMHSCFWLLPQDKITPGNPAAGTEIDVVEFFGENPKNPHGVGAFIHSFDPAGSLVKDGRLFEETELMKPDTWSTGYHVFSAEWTPTEYVFRVDGREFWRTSANVSQSPEYLMFSMLTSNYELVELDPADVGAIAEVDWVRTWER